MNLLILINQDDVYFSSVPAAMCDLYSNYQALLLCPRMIDYLKERFLFLFVAAGPLPVRPVLSSWGSAQPSARQRLEVTQQLAIKPRRKYTTESAVQIHR